MLKRKEFILGAAAGLTIAAGATAGGVITWPGAHAEPQAVNRISPNPGAAGAFAPPPGAPNSFANIFDQVAPAVVQIDVTTRVERPRGLTIPGLPFRFVPPEGQGGDDEPQTAQGAGSGFFISQDGFIVTNNHVVADATEIKVKMSDGRELPARLIGRDQGTDLAVIKVEDVSGLTVAELGDSSQVRVGDTVIAMGSPQGLNGTVTSGIVSALNRPVKLAGEGTDTDGVADAIQTDASINPGNSGGPLVDVRGAVIGINTVIYSVSGGSQGLGFAIPINMAKDIAEQLIAGEQPVHPDIGIAARTAANGAVTGAEVATVVPDGPADAAGIREGDVITAVGERSVGSADELTVAIWGVPVGETVRVTLVRDGQTMELDVTPAG